MNYTNLVAAVSYEVKSSCCVKDWGWNETQKSCSCHMTQPQQPVLMERNWIYQLSAYIHNQKWGVFKYFLNYSFYLLTQLFNISWVKFLLGFFLHPKMSPCLSPSVAFSCTCMIFLQCYGEHTAQITGIFPMKMENDAVYITMSWHRCVNPRRTEILKDWSSGL